MSETRYFNETKEESISWSAILGGVLVALTLWFVFNLLGTGIGFAVFLPNKEALWSLSVGGFIWVILIGIGAMYVGGWVAGRFSNGRTAQAGILYGIMVMGISTLISLIIITTALGSLLGNSFAAMQQAISISQDIAKTTPSTINKALTGISKLSPEITNKIRDVIPDLNPVIDKINDKAGDLFLQKKQSGEISGDELKKIKSQLEKLILAYLDSPQGREYEIARAKLFEQLQQTTGMTAEDINQKIDDWKASYQEAKEKIYEKTSDISKKIAKTISQIAMTNFFFLLFTLLAATAGGIKGVKNKPY